MYILNSYIQTFLVSHLFSYNNRPNNVPLLYIECSIVTLTIKLSFGCVFSVDIFIPVEKPLILITAVRKFR